MGLLREFTFSVNQRILTPDLLRAMRHVQCPTQRVKRGEGHTEVLEIDSSARMKQSGRRINMKIMSDDGRSDLAIPTSPSATTRPLWSKLVLGCFSHHSHVDGDQRLGSLPPAIESNVVAASGATETSASNVVENQSVHRNSLVRFDR